MWLTFRTKLMAIVAITACAFILLIATGALIARRVERQVSTIRERYLPKVELEPQLDSEFERIRRGFQDAVSSRDVDVLAATNDPKSRFLEHLDAARSAVDPEEAAALRAALNDYYTAAYGVSRRLISGETGEALVDAMAAMQTKHSVVVRMIKKAAALDRQELAQAFASVARAENAATSYELWICVACLLSVLALSLGLSRGVLRALADLTDGFARFGKGDFSRPIRVASHDELGDVARHANQMSASLEALGRERDHAENALKLANRELEAFSYSVAHDLRAPLRGMNGFAQVLLDSYNDKLDSEGKDWLQEILLNARKMGELIDGLLSLARVTRSELKPEDLDLSAVVREAAAQLTAAEPGRAVELAVQDHLRADVDSRLARALFENLLGNALKFTRRVPAACVEFGAIEKDGARTFFVRDNGAGFDMAFAGKLFAPFQRLHTVEEFPGTGIGLATVQRIVHRHGGRIWAEGAVGGGATFYFTFSSPIRGHHP
jgi:signal transduction histidine kinase